MAGLDNIYFMTVFDGTENMTNKSKVNNAPPSSETDMQLNMAAAAGCKCCNKNIHRHLNPLASLSGVT